MGGPSTLPASRLTSDLLTLTICNVKAHIFTVDLVPRMLMTLFCIVSG